MRYGVGRWASDRWNRESVHTFSVSGRSANTSAAAGDCLCNLWNPSGSRSLWVLEISFAQTNNRSALDPLRICRTTTEGTPGSTVTPDLDNDYEQRIPPETGALLHLANFSVEPTLATPELGRFAFAITGTWHTYTLDFRSGVRIPPGTGLAIATTGAVAATDSDLTFRFRE